MFKKKLLLVLLVLLSICIAFRIHDYIILAKISDATDEFLNTEKSELHNKETIYLSNGTQEIEEIYKKNNVISKEYRTIDNNVEIDYSKSWLLLDSGKIYNRYDESQYNNENVLVCGHQEETELRKTVEQYGKISYYSYDIKNKIYFTNNDNNKVVNFINNIKNKIFYPIVKSGEYNGIECYVFSKGHVTWYVEKETLLNAAVKMNYDELDENMIYGYLHEYSYENNVSDKNIELPNKENFDTVKFIDYNGNLGLLSENTEEYSLSGTNLKSGEKLIENVELLQEEDLNFLDFTGNSSGIKTLTITSLETYNKFREKYSNLRELTQEDFSYYNVTIAYKDGYKLNYIEEHESKESWILNYIVNSKQTKNKNLLLIVVPKENRNSNANVIEYNKKINISANDAFDRVNENIDEYKKTKNLSTDFYMGLSSDYIEILDNETFAKMDYIKTPVKGNEPICWLLRYTVYDVLDNSKISSIEFYVDATTGELIGAIEN